MRKIPSTFVRCFIPLASFVFAGTVAALTPSDPTVGSWPSFGNGPSHTGFYPATIGDVTTTPGWTKTFPDTPIKQVAVSDGRVYVTTTGYNAANNNNASSVFAAGLDAITGTELWRHPLDGFPDFPAVTGNTVVVQLSHSFDLMHVLGAADGSVKWIRQGYGSHASPTATVLGDRIWANTSYGLYSFLISNNSQQFVSTLDDPYGCTNSYNSGVIYLVERNNFRALDPESGSRLWSLPLEVGYLDDSVPAIMNGKAFFTTYDSSYLTAIDLVSKAVSWRTSYGPFYNRPATDGSTVYVYQGSGINAYAADTGQLRGRFVPNFAAGSEFPLQSSQPLVTNDLVIHGTSKATYIFDKTSFQVRAKLPVGGYVSYAAGVLYVADPIGNLVTYRFTNALPEPSPSPSPSPSPTPGPLTPAEIEVASINRDGTATANSVSSATAVSTGNGRFVLFRSQATDLTSVPDNNGQIDLFLRDRRSGATHLISINASNTAASAAGGDPPNGAKLTPDGRFVVYSSGREDLVGGTTGNFFASDVFVRDVQAEQTICASVGMDGQPGTGHGADISADGRYVVFVSSGPNLVPGHTQGPADVFLRDLVTNTTTLVSPDEGGRGIGDAEAVSISRNGRFILFLAYPRPPTVSDPVHPQLFLRDLIAKTTTMVTRDMTNTGISDATPLTPIMSEDGRFVVFQSSATNILPRGDGGYYHQDVYLRDVQLGVTERVSSAFDTAWVGDMSADGQVIAFLVRRDASAEDTYVYDRRAGTTQQLITSGGVVAVDLDATGRFVLFEAEGQVAGIGNDLNGYLDVFLHDRLRRTTRLVSHNVAGTASGDADSGIRLSDRPLITDDAQTVVFTSHATDLVTVPKFVTPPSVGRYDDVYVSSIAPSGRLLNISTRGQVLNGDQILIGGFILSGNSSKKIMIRAIGPSLTAAGVSGALSDPTLELRDSTGALVASNDNWIENQSEIFATGIAPSNYLESAIVRSLSPGAYTAIVRGKGGVIGVGLVELYDLEQGADSELANISTRDSVDTGDKVMIAGLIAGAPDSGAARVLVRALGPSLSASGVAGALQDPVLELRDFHGVLVASNDDWKADQRGEIEASGIAPGQDSESALLFQLAPGPYTAIVRGKSNSTGVGLVEVYHLQ